MVRTLTSKGTLAARAASALALVGALFMVSSASAASGISLSANPSTVAPGGTVTVTLAISPGSGETVAGFTAAVSYDESVLTATACTPASLCNLALGPGQVGFAPFDTGGIETGDVTVTFTVAPDASGSTDLGLTISACANELGASLTCNPTGTSITIEEPATDTPAPSVTASPSPTPGSLPKTGGNPGDSSSNSIVWLLAASGLAIVAGGAWAVARARREI